MDNQEFKKTDNIAKSLTDGNAKGVAQNMSKRWEEATSEIRSLINESRDGWDHYLRNRPSADNVANNTGARLDSLNKSVQPTARGLRYGTIPRSVDSVMSVLHNNLFPSDERFFRGTPRNGVAREYQELYEQYRADNFAEDNTTEELRKFLLTACIDPAACLALSWNTKTRDKVVYEAPSIKMGGIEVPLPVMGLKQKTIKDYVEWEGTHVEALDFNDWRIDPAARNFDDCWFMRRWYVPTWEVKKQYGIKDVPAYYASFGYPEDPSGNQKRLSYGLINPIPFSEEEDGKEQALLMVCYDDFVIDGKPYENHVALTLNGQKLLYFGPNPYHHGLKPYIVAPLMAVPGQIYGLSLIKHAIPSAAVIDTIVDKVLKIGALAADPIFEIDMSEPAYRKSIQIKPGMTIPVKRLGGIRQIQVNVANLSILENIMEKAEANIREVTGASQEITGEDFTQQPANVTAFQVDQRTQAASGRFQAIMTNICQKVLDPLMFMTFENDRQYKTQDEVIYTGQDETKLTVNLIKQMDFRWVITSANATSTRGKKLANLRSLILEIAPGLIQAGALKLSPDVLLFHQDIAIKQMCALAGITNTDELMEKAPPPPPMPQLTPNEQGGMNGPTGVPQTQQGGPGPVPPVAPAVPSIPSITAQNGPIPHA